MPPHDPVVAGLREGLADAAARLFHSGFLTELGGNLNARLPRGEAVLITPSGLPKGRLRAEDMLEVDLLGLPARVSGEPAAARLRPSVEARAHASIYRRRPDVQAIVHGHPPCATQVAGLSCRSNPRFPRRPGAAPHRCRVCRPSTTRSAGR
jgi:ribulose-5-phosphate 4-epimerase/fuculose-1-phosphate aldolase